MDKKISWLLQKIYTVNEQENQPALIDIDLMLEHTRQLYGHLLDSRRRTEPEERSTGEQQASGDLERHAAPQTLGEEDQDAAAPVAQEEQGEQEEQEEQGEQEEQPGTQTLDLSMPYKRRTDIRQLIELNDKYVYIQELFNNNAEAYDDVVKQINKFSTFEEAANWLNWFIHDQYKWRDDTGSVQRFYETLSRFFESI